MRRRPGLTLAACLFVCAVLIIGQYFVSPAYGAVLGPRSLQLSDSRASAIASYLASLTLTTDGQLGSIRIQLCSDGPLLATPCTPPAGLDVSGATLAAADQSGQTGFTIGTQTANMLLITRSPAAASADLVSYKFENIVNPIATGSYYARLQTYASNDGTGPATDYGGIAFSINTNLSITATVPPYLTFCTGITISGLDCANARGDTVNFGELLSSRAKVGSSQMLVATNAAEGFSITMQGTTLTSGNNVITAMSVNDASRSGVGQFGMNLRTNTSPPNGNEPTGPGISVPEANYNQPNSYRFVSGDTLVTRPGPEDVRQFTSSYLANVPKTQAAGLYVTTLTYVCLANF